MKKVEVLLPQGQEKWGMRPQNRNPLHHNKVVPSPTLGFSLWVLCVNARCIVVLYIFGGEILAMPRGAERNL